MSDAEKTPETACDWPVNSQTKLLAKSVSSCPPAAKLRVSPASDAVVRVLLSVGRALAPTRASPVELRPKYRASNSNRFSVRPRAMR